MRNLTSKSTRTMNNSIILTNNHTTPNKTFVDDYTSMIFAGHLLLIFYCVIFIFGFLGNIAVIYVGIRKKKYQNVTNCYVINLALADLLFLSLSIPYTTYLALVDRYPFGELFCRIHMYLAYVFLLSTCNTLAAMSVDRYFYIVLPRSKLQYRTPRHTINICIMIWIGSFILIIPYLIITTNLKICHINEQKNFLICFLIFCLYYAIPLMIIIICYTKLAVHVIQSNRVVLSRMNNKGTRNSLKIRRKQITRMVIVVTLVFAICWLPVHILELMQCAQSSILFKLLRTHPKVLYAIRAFTHASAYINSCLNPYLYALLNRNFCFDLIDTIQKCFTCLNPRNFRHRQTNYPNKRIFATPEIIINEQHFKKHSFHDDEDEDNDETFEHEENHLTYINANS